MSKTNGKTNKTDKTHGDRKEPYSFETFVKNWSKAASVAEVVAMTGLTKNTVSAMSGKLRKAGVQLKQMPRRTARVIDKNALNRIVKESTPAKSA